MLLDIGPIRYVSGSVLPFEFSLDLSDMMFYNEYPAKEPVQVKGQVQNVAGVLVLTAEIETVLHAVCDRCAASFLRKVEIPVEAVLVSELSNEESQDDLAVFDLQGNYADLSELATTVFVLNIDTKNLCREDCKGLCAKCGANLNEGSCGCQAEMDPRLAVLKQLLKDKE